MPKLIIGFVGQAGCGKGTAADILRKEYGADYFRFSAIMGDMLDRLWIERSRENLIKISEAMRKYFGESVFSYAIEKDAAKSINDLVVVDGIRRMEDIHALQALPHFKLVAIDAPEKLRYERITHRGEKAHEKDMTWERFLEEERAPTEVTIPGVMARAWKTVSNETTQEAFAKKIHELMTELGIPTIHRPSS